MEPTALAPIPDPDSVAFWEATAEGEIRITRCPECQRWHHPPLERCRVCATRLRFEPISGHGTVYSFIVTERAVSEAFASQTPYTLVLVELDEQQHLRFVGRLLGEGAANVQIGDRVRALLTPIEGSTFQTIDFMLEML